MSGGAIFIVGVYFGMLATLFFQFVFWCAGEIGKRQAERNERERKINRRLDDVERTLERERTF